jgi:hypothetical protein
MDFDDTNVPLAVDDYDGYIEADFEAVAIPVVPIADNHVHFQPAVVVPELASADTNSLTPAIELGHVWMALVFVVALIVLGWVSTYAQRQLRLGRSKRLLQASIAAVQDSTKTGGSVGGIQRLQATTLHESVASFVAALGEARSNGFPAELFQADIQAFLDAMNALVGVLRDFDAFRGIYQQFHDCLLNELKSEQTPDTSVTPPPAAQDVEATGTSNALASPLFEARSHGSIQPTPRSANEALLNSWKSCNLIHDDTSLQLATPFQLQTAISTVREALSQWPHSLDDVAIDLRKAEEECAAGEKAIFTNAKHALEQLREVASGGQHHDHAVQSVMVALMSLSLLWSPQATAATKQHFESLCYDMVSEWLRIEQALQLRSAVAQEMQAMVTAPSVSDPTQPRRPSRSARITRHVKRLNDLGCRLPAALDGCLTRVPQTLPASDEGFQSPTTLAASVRSPAQDITLESGVNALTANATQLAVFQARLDLAMHQEMVQVGRETMDILRMQMDMMHRIGSEAINESNRRHTEQLARQSEFHTELIAANASASALSLAQSSHALLQARQEKLAKSDVKHAVNIILCSAVLIAVVAASYFSGSVYESLNEFLPLTCPDTCTPSAQPTGSSWSWMSPMEAIGAKFNLLFCCTRLVTSVLKVIGFALLTSAAAKLHHTLPAVIMLSALVKLVGIPPSLMNRAARGLVLFLVMHGTCAVLFSYTARKPVSFGRIQEMYQAKIQHSRPDAERNLSALLEGRAWTPRDVLLRVVWPLIAFFGAVFIGCVLCSDTPVTETVQFLDATVSLLIAATVKVFHSL